METNPYLLGLTIVVSIVHSIFEFLAFKNGKATLRQGQGQGQGNRQPVGELRWVAVGVSIQSEK